jgi:hypothetical protein
MTALLLVTLLPAATAQADPFRCGTCGANLLNDPDAMVLEPPGEPARYYCSRCFAALTTCKRCGKDISDDPGAAWNEQNLDEGYCGDCAQLVFTNIEGTSTLKGKLRLVWGGIGVGVVIILGLARVLGRRSRSREPQPRRRRPIVPPGGRRRAPTGPAARPVVAEPEQQPLVAEPVEGALMAKVVAEPAEPAADERIRLSCPGCGKRLAIPSSKAGRRGACPSCKTTIDIPTS